MMRLIDGDKLKEKVLKWLPPDPCGREGKEYPVETDIVVSLLMEIDEAPTIEKSKGKWIEDYADENCRYVRCSRCDITQVFYYGKLNTNYCPNCGAKMGYKDETNRPNRG